MLNMIRNERQFRITKAKADEFQQALEEFDRASTSDMHPIQWQAHRNALTSQYNELLMQLEEYDSLRSGQQTVLELHSIEELPDAFIKARIAAGLSQKDLAERLGLKEQQIQRYESTGYQTASLSRIYEIVRALGISIREDVFLPNLEISARRLFDQLEKSGLQDDLVIKRILPRQLVDLVQSEVGNGEQTKQLALRSAHCLNKIFDWDITAIFGGEPLKLAASITGTTRFKVTGRTDTEYLNSYTMYAYYICRLVQKASQDLPVKPVPTDAGFVRETIIREYGDISFENTLHYIWSLGIPVVPLVDPGAFHGACWRVNGRNLIALKQNTTSISRWHFDSLHEFRHAGEQPEDEDFTVLEAEGTSSERRDSEQEEEASLFAADVLLDGRAEELVEECVNRAKRHVPRLKSVVQNVAKEANVSTGVLANYLAFRLWQEDVNWWGAAANLQEHGNPQDIARNILFQNIHLGYLTTSEQDVLIRSQSNL